MKIRLLLLISAILLGMTVASSKPQKIKYGKNAYYEGEVVNKTPNGNGILVLMSQKDKNENVATITGKFEANKIYNAEIKSTLLPSIKVIGSQPITFEVKEKNKGFIFNISKVSFEDNSSVYTIEKLNTELTVVNKQWVSNIVKPKNSLVVLDSEITSLPSHIAKYWSNPSRVIRLAFVKDGKFVILNNFPFISYSINPLFIFNGYVYSPNANSFIPVEVTEDNDGVNLVINKHVPKSNDELGFKIASRGDGWSGIRILDDGTVIKGNQDAITITINDLDIYSGSLLDPMQPVQQSLKSFNDLKLKKDNYKMYGKKYIGGESEDIIRTRLQYKGVENDIIESVISGWISEPNAILKQQQRDEEKKRIADNKCKNRGVVDSSVRREKANSKPSTQKKSKRRYHDIGKQETCPACNGSGLATKYLGQKQKVCIMCGGKGWYIEHYW